MQRFQALVAKCRLIYVSIGANERWFTVVSNGKQYKWCWLQKEGRSSCVERYAVYSRPVVLWIGSGCVKDLTNHGV